MIKEKMLKELEEKFGCTDVDVYDDMVSMVLIILMFSLEVR